MNYEDMDNFEINKLVFKAIYPGMALDINPARNIESELVGVGETVRGLFKREFVTEFKYFDYCNNPSDAWPIIELIWEELMQADDYYQAHTKWDAYCTDHNVGKLRAAMICFLKMKDAENGR